MSAHERGDWSIGIDIGGTFTDIVAVDAATDRRFDGKVLTTPADPLEGFMSALDLLEKGHGVGIDLSKAIVHATTLAINTVIERKGARVAMLTTEKFRDIVEIGSEDRYDLYDLQIEFHRPLVPRHRRIGIRERIAADGTVLTPLDEVAVDDAITALEDVEAIVVAFLNSYANPEHEERAARIVAHLRPDLYVTTSADVAPIIREYPRFTAATISAYVGPRVAGYMGALEGALGRRDYTGAVGVMKSDGGMFTPAAASRYPVRMLESGPAAGVLSAAHTAVECGEPLALAFDMGGTTAKVCLVTDGEPAMTEELEVARLGPGMSGSGMPVRIPSLDLIEIGAGGGSIAWIDKLGIMQVGPRSANSVPGPACYGTGGKLPTVTDADLLLGYLIPEFFAGGSLHLSTEKAQRAFTENILDLTGTSDVISAAWGVHDIVNENMARAARFHCLEHGIDPARATIVATGGAGPVHAAAIMKKLGAKAVISPPSAGVASAFGLLLAPHTLDRITTEMRPLAEMTDNELRERLDRIADDLRIQEEARGRGEPSVTAWVSMRLKGQGHELRVRVPEPVTVAGVNEAFEHEYTARFGRAPWGAERQIVEWVVRLTWAHELPSLSPLDPEGSLADATIRSVYFGPAFGWLDTRVTDRSMLRSEERPAAGPLLLPEAGTTIVVTPDCVAYVDSFGNVVVSSAENSADGAERDVQTISAA